MFSLRAVIIDHYLSKPIYELYEKEEQNFLIQWQEPVLRIFGSTADGVKSCVHVHGVYPYMYVPYKGGENPVRDALLLGAALDEALKGNADHKSSRFVYKVILISGIPLYGYHSKHRQFFKIFFYNPYYIRKASELLLSGAILGQKLQPHEAHIPYVLQFMMDYNIYGMSFVTFSKIKYRRNTEIPDSLADISEGVILSDKVKKMTCSYFEVDALARDIVNKCSNRVAGVNPGLQAIWNDEKARRRALDKISQITIQPSQSRPNVKMSASEAMYKERLLKKLEEVLIQEPEITEIVGAPKLSYPAEVPINSEILEASVLDDGVEHSPTVEPIADVRNLINETILSQMASSEKENGNSESDEERTIEADSVLGRNQKEEEELEGDDGGDMTQPLNFEENMVFGCRTNRDEQGESSDESNEDFWKNMADRILQFDGAQDSSSESDPEATHDSLEFAKSQIPFDSLSCHRSPSSESVSNWPNNIMSILSEDSACPTPSTVCQTPQTFWSNYSPEVDLSWLPQNQESWSWNKNDATGCFSAKSPSDDVCDLPVATPSESSKEMNSNELCVNLFESNQNEYFPGNYTPVSASSPLSNIGSLYTLSPPSAILTPASEVDSYSDINLDFICDNASQILSSPSRPDEEKNSPKTHVIQSKTINVPKVHKTRKKADDDQEKLMDVLKNFATFDRKRRLEDNLGQTVSLTLKQYIKNCGEIVNVDFKNLGGREMVIIEYKPLKKGSSQNKFLIKPLDKFLESWNAAEVKVNEVSKRRKNCHVVDGFEESNKNNDLRAIINPLEHKYTGDWLDSSKIKSIKNKFIVKTVEMLPRPSDELNILDRKSYKVNENVVSQGKIKMKLIKSQLKNSKKEPRKKCDAEEMNSGTRSEFRRTERDLNDNKISMYKLNKMVELKKESQVKSKRMKNRSSECRRERKNEMFRRKKSNSTRRRQFSEELINEINSSFEDYFKRIVKVNNYCRNNEKTFAEDGSQSEEEDEEDSDVDSSSALDPIKFVTQLVSTFSRMSRSSEIPPLSITISLGDASKSESVPIRLNLQPATVSLGKTEVKRRNKKHRRKMKIENVDGPADGSSDDDSSLDRDSKSLTSSQKKPKRDGFYRPLNVVLRSSSLERKATRRKRKISGYKSGEEEVGVPKNPSMSAQEDYFVGCSSNSNSPSIFRKEEQQVTRPRSKETHSSENLTKFEKEFGDFGERSSETKSRLKSLADSCSGHEPDFIFDSDEETQSMASVIRKRRIRKLARRNAKKSWLKIPQADVAGTSSDDSEFDRRRRALRKNVNSSSFKEDAEKNKKPDESVKESIVEDGLDKRSLVLAESLFDHRGLVKRPPSIDCEEVLSDSPKKSSNRGSTPSLRAVVSESSKEPKNIISQSVFEKKLTPPELSLCSSELEKMAVNSDDSLKVADTTMLQPQTTSPFSLSGTRLFAENSNSGSPPMEQFTPQEFHTISFSSQQEVPKPESLCLASLHNPSDSLNPLPCIETKAQNCHETSHKFHLQADLVAELNFHSPEEVLFSSADSVGLSHLSQSSVSLPKASLDFSELENFSLTVSEYSKNDSQSAEIISINGSKTVYPKQKPPTRNEVVTFLSQCQPVEGSAEAPFYSNPRDITKSIEMGPRVLKIVSNSAAGLKSHKSTLDILGTEEKRNHLLNLEKKGCSGMRNLLVADKDITITPLKRPPSPKKLLEKLDVQNRQKEKENIKERAKVKVVMPSSPGQECGSDDETELSMTLGTPAEDAGNDGILSKRDIVPDPSGDEKESKSSSESSHSSYFIDRQDSVLHSIPLEGGLVRVISEEPEKRLKKGPLNKIKGIKRFSLGRQLEAISEEIQVLEKRDDGSPGNLSSSGTRLTKESKKSSEDSFQIRGITVDNTFGFSASVENMQDVKLNDAHQYVSMFVMELHVQTRQDLRPDPQHDPIRALFYTITFDSPRQNEETGIVVVGDNLLKKSADSTKTVHYVPTETELIGKTIELINIWDPDILAGYEIEMNSWGYLVQRAFELEADMFSLLGRVRGENFAWKDASQCGSETDGFEDIPRSVRHLKISGRIVLDVWRLLRHEVALTSYTFENVMYHLSHERHPLLSYKTLSLYWEHPSHRFRHITVEHYIARVKGVVKLLDQLDFIGRTSELSRLFGIQFYEVLSRGSQFRVESMMLRLAKPLNYIPASPSVAQRAEMRAPACLPLILEPESLFYTDPLIVLDFQSLYPSMIIAYNYCFSTCLGRVEKLGRREPFEFGCTQLQISPEELKSLGNDITISPAGVAFVTSNVRKGVLPRMLEEILETRLMVKKSMKENVGNKILEKVLYARQLGLKLIANVTYGYTAANFSGRMPCIEVGDSVVSKGRETLHRAIQLVKTNRKWGAKVVYGDTDSLFVLTPGKTRKEAFEIGAEIAEAVTQDNPKPVKLKLEKVYQPSILQTKKRYVGYMYERPDQEKPVFEAKGIETVRRDGCPAVGKILQKALQILFDTRDVSLVKKYTVRQFTKLFRGRVNVQDLIFAKEYRGRKGYRPGACVPALQLAKQWTQYDKRAEPRVKERVPYVIVNGPPGLPLIRLVRTPMDLISDSSLRINAVYYITKAIIPPMQRCFSLLGADVTSWYSEMPRKYHKMYKPTAAEGQKKSTISQYFSTVECVVCSSVTNSVVCCECEKQPQLLAVCLIDKVRRWERCHAGVLKICQSCCGRPTEIDCQSIDCPVFFRRHKASRDLDQVPVLREIMDQYL